MEQRILVTKELILTVLDIKERQLTNLVKSEIIEKVNDRYNLVSSLKNYLEMKGVYRKDSLNEIVNAKSLGAILGIAERTVMDLSTKGVIVKLEKDSYDKDSSIANYINYLKETLDKNTQGRDEELKKKRADRELKELKLKEEKKDLHRTEDIQLILKNMILNFRGKSLVLPFKLAPVLSLEKDVDNIEEIIRKNIHELLEELSEWDPEEGDKNE